MNKHVADLFLQASTILDHGFSRHIEGYISRTKKGVIGVSCNRTGGYYVSRRVNKRRLAQKQCKTLEAAARAHDELLIHLLSPQKARDAGLNYDLGVYEDLHIAKILESTDNATAFSKSRRLSSPSPARFVVLVPNFKSESESEPKPEPKPKPKPEADSVYVHVPEVSTPVASSSSEYSESEASDSVHDVGVIQASPSNVKVLDSGVQPNGGVAQPPALHLQPIAQTYEQWPIVYSNSPPRIYHARDIPRLPNVRMIIEHCAGSRLLRLDTVKDVYGYDVAWYAIVQHPDGSCFSYVPRMYKVDLDWVNRLQVYSQILIQT